MDVGAQALLGHGAFERALAIGTEFAVFADQAGIHLSIAVGFFSFTDEALQLRLTGPNHALPNHGRTFRHAGRPHFLVVHRLLQVRTPMAIPPCDCCHLPRVMGVGDAERESASIRECSWSGSFPRPWHISRKRKPSGRGAGASLRDRQEIRGGSRSCRERWRVVGGRYCRC
jgi:hypothetical protein